MNGCVLPEVLETICKQIGEEWRKLIEELHSPKITQEYLDTLENNAQFPKPADKMGECFKFLDKRIQWRALRDALETIDQEPLRKEILETSLVTRGLCCFR